MKTFSFMSIVPGFRLKQILHMLYYFFFKPSLYDSFLKLNVRFNDGLVVFKIYGIEYSLKIKTCMTFHFLSYYLNTEMLAYFHNYMPKSGDIVFDLGGYMGAFTFYMSKLVGDKGRVYTFEPNPENYLIIQNIIDDNKLTNVVLIKKGIFNKTGNLEFYGSGSSGNFVNIYNEGRNNTFEVISLDDFVRQYSINSINYIKSDIESAEIQLLEGAKESIKKGVVKNWAIASYHRLTNEKRAYIDCEKILKDYNVDFKTKFWGGTTPFVTYIRQDKQ